MLGKNREMDMCSGAITPKLVAYAVPLILSGFLQLLFNAADMAIVGQFGTNGERSLAAVGATGPLVNLLVNIFIGLSVGANAIVAKRCGQGDNQGVRKAVHTSVFLGIASGIAAMIIGLLFTKYFLGIMSTPSDIIDLSTLYLRIYFIGAPFSTFYNFGSAILRAIGDTKRPLYFLTLSGVINVLLNLLLVIVFRLDVAGVAIATVVSQIVSAVLVFFALIRHGGNVRLFVSEIKLYTEEFKQIVRIGIPASIQSCMFSVANMLVQSSINFFGTQTIAACSAASSIEGFVYVGMNSFYQTTLSFVSQNFGRNNMERIKKITVRAVFLVTITSIIFGTFVLVFNERLMGLYLQPGVENKAEIIRIGFERTLIVIAPYFLCGVSEVIVGTLRGIGQSFIPMISSVIGICGGRLLWIYTVFAYFKYGTGIEIFGIHFTPLQILALAWPVSWLVSLIMHLATLIWEFRKHRKKLQRIESISVVRVEPTQTK